MKVSAYVCLLYGKDYLAHAIRSVVHQVDEIVVAYTPTPSHGQRTDLSCPDSRDELHELAERAAGYKLRWHDSKGYHHEGLHRTAGVELCRHDVVMVLDADEVWDARELALALETVERLTACRNFLVNPYHLWKSFNHVCIDNMWPVRFIRKSAPVDGETFYLKQKYAHMGYARSVKDIEYKISIHGHKNEWREGWLDMYRSWKFGMMDVHPTCNDVWNPEPFDSKDLPAVLVGHEFYNLESIE